MNYIGMSPLTPPLQNVGSNLHAEGRVENPTTPYILLQPKDVGAVQ